MAVEWVFVVALLSSDPRVEQKLEISQVQNEAICLKMVSDYRPPNPTSIKHWIAACAKTDDLMALQNLAPPTKPPVRK